MKKTICLILAGLLCLAAGCGAGAGRADRTAGSNAQTVTDILENAAAETAPQTVLSTPAPAVSDVLPDLSSPDAEVDLTLLSGTMVYSQVYDMVYYPENYFGKTVKMNGTFAVYEGKGRNYYACLIADAAACCSQGIEFVWKGEHAWPEDYPAPGEVITVTGVFETYEEDGYTYLQLADAVLT